MGLAITHKIMGFKIYQCWVTEDTYEVKGCDRALFYFAKNNSADFQIAGYGLTNMIDLNQNINKIYHNFNRTTRNEVRQAERLDTFIIKINQDYDAFIDLVDKFAKVKNLHIDRLSKVALLEAKHFLGTIYYNDTILAGHYYIAGDDYVSFTIAGRILPSENEYKKIVSRASRYLHFKMMQYVKEEGYSKFYLGALDYEGHRSIARYKEGFGGVEVRHPYYKRDYNLILKLATRFGR